ncbi:MAG: IclR family transcriptional regulator [Haloplanus sp.]
MSNNRARPVKTTLTSIRIVNEVKRREGATLTDISDALGLAKSTVHNHLATLTDEGLLVADGQEYHIGLRFLEFGQHALHRRELYLPAKVQAHRLAEATNEEANFSVAENGFMYPIEYVMGDSDPNDPEIGSKFLKVGNKFHMHTSSSGKAVLAELPEEEVERIVDSHGLPAPTDNTITSREALFEELAATRERGYATNDEELQTGFRSIAAPISLPDGSVIGGLAVGGPAYRFELTSSFLSRFVELLQDAVDTVETEIARLESDTPA